MNEFKIDGEAKRSLWRVLRAIAAEMGLALGPMADAFEGPASAIRASRGRDDFAGVELFNFAIPHALLAALPKRGPGPTTAAVEQARLVARMLGEGAPLPRDGELAVEKEDRIEASYAAGRATIESLLDQVEQLSGALIDANGELSTVRGRLDVIAEEAAAERAKVERYRALAEGRRIPGHGRAMLSIVGAAGGVSTCPLEDCTIPHVHRPTGEVHGVDMSDEAFDRLRREMHAHVSGILRMHSLSPTDAVTDAMAELRRRGLLLPPGSP